MNNKSLVKKVMEKISKKPMLGSFYLLGNTIYYSTAHGGIDHKRLWTIIVANVFKGLDPKDKEKMREAGYGADRGRVSWDGELVGNTPHGQGNYLLEGTPGCEKYEDLIKGHFGIKYLKNVKTDWQSSEVYITIPREKKFVEDMIKKYDIPLKNMHLASQIKFICLD